jgi:flavin reductase (DIM6/NTAB) family NADH-FMN oxidoreductase RutF
MNEAAMFYRPATGHGLPHNPFNAIVAPRPIAWISTRGSAGDNLAPYSLFNAVAYRPPQVIFACDAKDTLANVRETGVFAINLVSRPQLEAMNQTSAHYPRGTDEFAAVGVARAECQTIACPRVLDSPATLECRMVQIVDLVGGEDFLTIGVVEAVHLRDDCLQGGRFDLSLARLVCRLGYRDYAEVDDIFALDRPDDPVD